MMEGSLTKQKILDVSLELFSTKGYEATSLAQIAEAVGVRKASLYSHYESKQAILETILEQVDVYYSNNSIFSKANWENPEFRNSLSTEISFEKIVDQIKGQMMMVLHDPKISGVRKMLTIEQFQNPRMAALQTKTVYENVYRHHLGLIRFLMEKDILIQGDAEAMAAQYCFPISMWLNLCDREPEREEEAMELIERHVKQFYIVYGKRA